MVPGYPGGYSTLLPWYPVYTLGYILPIHSRVHHGTDRTLGLMSALSAVHGRRALGSVRRIPLGERPPRLKVDNPVRVVGKLLRVLLRLSREKGWYDRIDEG